MSDRADLPPSVWDVARVDEWAEARGLQFEDEQLGSKVKFWLRDGKGRRWLFKFARTTSSGVVVGEDWAECLVHGLSALLGIPTARVRIATYRNRRGVIVLTLAPTPLALEHGDELIAAVRPGYDRGVPRNNPDLTVQTVMESLVGLTTPRVAGDAPLSGAFDLWAGYLMMDAWVAGTDRHPQNWGALRDGHDRWLAPSYDHGNALGFQLLDGQRASYVSERVLLQRWAEKGTNSSFSGRPTLVNLMKEALLEASGAARHYWLGRLRAVDEASVQSLVEQVPDGLLSDVGRTFVVELLKCNRRRILDVFDRDY